MNSKSSPTFSKVISMHLIYNDVNHAFNSMIEGINNGTIETIKTDSRNGPVLQIPEPVIITYLNPRRRVLFNPGRDCNPFFHLYESLWMLAGRNDVAPLKTYASKIDQFSDDGVTFNGAYGYRWRHAQVDEVQNWVHKNGVDQLEVIIEHLKALPNSRRVVLQMWNVNDDLLKIGPEGTSKDVCCNTAVYFSLRYVQPECVKENSQGRCNPPSHVHNCPAVKKNLNPLCDFALDMTVTNRSNDIVWGMFGANAVHFSFLQEYLACAIGVEVGHYHQFSNNAHIYTESNSGFHPEKWLAYGLEGMHEHSTTRLFEDGDYNNFDIQNRRFVEDFSKAPEVSNQTYFNRFLNATARPMLHAFHMYKQKDDAAVDYWLALIESPDWRKASIEWIDRRRKERKEKSAKLAVTKVEVGSFWTCSKCRVFTNVLPEYHTCGAE